MSRRPRPLIRLETLRRSTRLAIFALAVFLVRVGVVAACAPSDYAELAAGGADASPIAAHVESGAADPDSQHATGHCLHCSCHQSVALPADFAVLLAVAESFPTVAMPLRQVLAPPDLSLRPPIL